MPALVQAQRNQRDAATRQSPVARALQEQDTPETNYSTWEIRELLLKAVEATALQADASQDRNEIRDELIRRLNPRYTELANDQLQLDGFETLGGLAHVSANNATQIEITHPDVAVKFLYRKNQRTQWKQVFKDTAQQIEYRKQMLREGGATGHVLTAEERTKYEGWIEALEFILETKEKHTNRQMYTEFQGVQEENAPRTQGRASARRRRST